MKKLIIAIDGFSSTGKSTLAKLLARELGYIHIDSGAMYRAIALYALNHGLVDNGQPKEKELIEALRDINIRFERNPETGENEIFLNDENVEREIREMSVSSIVSQVAKIAEVRDYAVNLQRLMGKNKGIVMDGRDIGTTVFPDADLKIFLTTSAETRAKRRYDELIKNNQKVSFDEVVENIRQRDLTDTTREISPLIKAEDAIEIDNGSLTPEKTVEMIMELINSQ